MHVLSSAMDNFDKTLEKLLSLISVNKKGETVLTNSGEKEVFCALIQSIPDEVAQAWLSSGKYCEYPMNYYLRGKIGYTPRRDGHCVQNLKRPISEVIADFNDKKRGKRTEAKNEMQQRFQSLDWKEQLLVFETMLEAAVSYKSYREWVFNTLRAYFWFDLDNIQSRFKSRKVKPIKELILRLCTEHLNEFYPALFAIKMCDLSFIQAHEKELIEAVDYYSVANRLMENPEFFPQRNLLAMMTDYLIPAGGKVSSKVIEKYKIKHTLDCGKAYYYLMAKHGRMVDKEEARGFLFKCIIYDDLKPSTQLANEEAKDFSLMRNQDMCRLLMNYGRLGFSELIMEYHEMEIEVQRKFQEHLTKDDCLWECYLKLFRQEAFSRYYSNKDLEKLKDENRIEYYRRLSQADLPIDEHEARRFLTDLVRDAKSLTLDRDMTHCRAEDYTLRLNHCIDELLNIFEQKGLNEALKGFAAFERDVMYRFTRNHYDTISDDSEAHALWKEFLEMAESELYNREHAVDNAKQLLENNPEMKSLFNDFDLHVVRYDTPI